MLVTSNPESTTTLTQLISEGRTGEIQLNKTHYLLRIGDNVYPLANALDSYMDFLIDICVDVRLNDVEYDKYYQNPKLLSKALYGTMDLWYILLRVNRCSSPFNFKSKVVKVVHPDRLDMINKMLNLSDERLSKSKNLAYIEEMPRV